LKYSPVLVKYKKGSGYENFVFIRQGKTQKERIMELIISERDMIRIFRKKNYICETGGMIHGVIYTSADPSVLAIR